MLGAMRREIGPTCTTYSLSLLLLALGGLLDDDGRGGLFLGVDGAGAGVDLLRLLLVLL